ncbi:hypothetical protein B0T25DRAFT_534492 [Lasiosphaeria hispida]|uniref:Uncharacterized protein n=1 Tax=Lasiosphaeria hispida TaxID=260671 RepID=A0AAJ0HRM8_9PEZI|nr:hypothetical protein B0T25DRAFT_534492 [Lasiosphaeria hispida]
MAHGRLESVSRVQLFVVCSIHCGYSFSPPSPPLQPWLGGSVSISSLPFFSHPRFGRDVGQLAAPATFSLVPFPTYTWMPLYRARSVCAGECTCLRRCVGARACVCRPHYFCLPLPLAPFSCRLLKEYTHMKVGLWYKLDICGHSRRLGQD